MHQGNPNPSPENRLQGAPKGNQNARRARIWRDALLEVMRRRDVEQQTDTLHELAMELILAALERQGWALKEIGDRLEGKATEFLATEDGRALVTAILMRAVDPPKEQPDDGLYDDGEVGR